MHIAPIVTLSPRPNNQSYINSCISSMKAAGIKDTITVFAEPLSPPIIDPSIKVIKRETLLGAWQNFIFALKQTLIEQPNADAILYVQDDCILLPDAISSFQKIAWPTRTTGLISLYTSQAYNGLPQNAVSLLKPERTLMGACAFVISRQAAYHLVARGLERGWRGHPKQKMADPATKKCIDGFTAEALRELGYDIYLFSPSLARHIGEASALGHGTDLKSKQESARNALIYRHTRPYTYPPSKVRLPEGTTGKGLPITAIIPVAGESSDLIQTCITSLLTDSSDLDIRIVVIANGVPQKTLQTIKNTLDSVYSRTLLILNEENEGFTKACNQGLRTLAQFQSHALLLNSDCRLAPNALRTLYNSINNPSFKLAAINPLTMDDGMCSLKHTQLRFDAGIKAIPTHPIDLKDMSFRVHRTTIKPTTSLPFFCTLLNYDALDQIGLLHQAEEFESGLGVDDEWCHRAISHDWNIGIHYGAFADHDHHETFKRLDLNRKQLQRKCLPLLSQIKANKKEDDVSLS